MVLGGRGEDQQQLVSPESGTDWLDNEPDNDF